MKMVVALSVVIGILALTPAAFAQSSGTGYAGEGGVAGQVSQGGEGNNGGNGKVAGTTAASQASESNGVLAFTGLDLALIAGGGLLLLVGGVALSRMVARHPA
jgi:hypothetical protein